MLKNSQMLSESCFLGQKILVTNVADSLYKYKIVNPEGIVVATGSNFPTVDDAIDQAEERITANVKPFNHG